MAEASTITVPVEKTVVVDEQRVTLTLTEREAQVLYSILGRFKPNNDTSPVYHALSGLSSVERVRGSVDISELSGALLWHPRA